MINKVYFEAYQSYCQLQREYRDIYKELEKQYEACKCFGCQLEVILFGLDLLNLNTIIVHMENQITPAIGSILTGMKIDHVETDGKTALIN